MDVTVEPLEVFGLVLPLLTMLARAVSLGGVLFLVLVLRPLGWTLGDPGTAMRRDTARLTALAALVVALCAGFAAQTAAPTVLAAADRLQAAWQAPFPAQVAAVETAAAALIALLLALGWAASFLLVPLAAVAFGAATLTVPPPPAADPRAMLGLVAAHQLGVALWLGALPALALSLGRVEDGLGWRPIAARFGRMSLTGLLLALASGIGLTVFTATGTAFDLGGLYGSRFGVLLAVKTLLALALATLPFRVLRATGTPGGRRLPITRLKRLAAVGLALGLTGFVVTGAVVALPPPVQRMADERGADRATPAQIATRAVPALPRIDSLASAPEAVRTWLADTQRRAGLAVLAIGVLSLLACVRFPLARQWPLLVVALGAVVFIYADPLSWPLGRIGPLDSLADPAVLGHRLLAVLLVVLGVNEWLVRGLRPGRFGWPLLLPLAMGAGGVGLLLLAGAGMPPAMQSLATLADAPLAVLLGMAAVARWQEVRLDRFEGRWAGWVWAGSVTLSGLLLLAYRLA